MGGGGDGREAEREGFGAPAVEFGRRDEARDGMVRGRRGEVLAEGEQRHAGGAEIAQGGADFGGGLAHAEHEGGLGPGAGVRRPAQAFAALDGRDYVIPDDVKQLAVAILAHRLIVKSQASLREIDPDAIVREILAQVPVGEPTRAVAG